MNIYVGSTMLATSHTAVLESKLRCEIIRFEKCEMCPVKNNSVSENFQLNILQIGSNWIN